MSERSMTTQRLTHFILGLGIFWIANAEAANEQRCNDLGAACICSEPLNTATYTQDTPSYFNPADTTSLDKQCLRAGGFPGTVLEDGQGFRYVVQTTGEMFAALPKAATPGLQLLRTKTTAEGNSGGGGQFMGHIFDSSAPTGRIAFRFYRYWSPTYQWTQQTPTCINSSKVVQFAQESLSTSGPILDGPSSHHQMYAWTSAGYNFPGAFDCCWFGPGPNGGNIEYDAPVFNGKWWRFEVVVRNPLPTGSVTIIEIYRRNVTDNRPEEKIIDTSMATSQPVGNQWDSTIASKFKPLGRISQIFIDSFRRDTCDGYVGYTHLLSAAWATDAGQRIGAAIEIEGIPSTQPPPGNLRLIQ
jgi:hypothetical protein